MRHIPAGAEEIFYFGRSVEIVGPGESELSRQAMKVIRFQRNLQGVVGRKTRRLNRIDLRQGGELRVKRARILLTCQIG